MVRAFHRPVLCLTASFSVISSGMALGFPSISIGQLLKIFSPLEVSWFASVTAITMIIGGLLSGYLCDKIGRKGTLVFSDTISLISFLLIGTASENFLFPQLIFARFLVGFHVGLSTPAALLYTAEVCSPETRGRLSMLSSSFFTALGMVVIYFLGAVLAVCNQKNSYQTASFYAASITFVTLILCLLIPESPTYYLNKNQLEKARKSFARISPNDPQIISDSQKLQKTPTSTSRWAFGEFKKPQLYKPFIMMLIFFCFQQFSGIYTIFIFAAQFSAHAGVVIDPQHCAVIVGVTRVLTLLAMAFLSDKAGRRPLSMISCTGMFIAMTGLATCGLNKENLQNTSLFWLPTFFLLFFIFSGTFGVLALPFAMLGEIYPQKSRGLAAGLTIAFAYAMSFVNVKTFVTVFGAFGSTTMFGFYAFVSLAAFLFSYFFLVETKGKTLLEIEAHFAGRARGEV